MKRKTTIRQIPISWISAHKFNVRKAFRQGDRNVVGKIVSKSEPVDLEEVDRLATSIGKIGLLHPLLVRDEGGNRFELIAGNRRYRAIKRLVQDPGYLVDVRIFPRDTTDEECKELLLSENLQRKKVSLDELGETIYDLVFTGVLAVYPNVSEQTFATALWFLYFERTNISLPMHLTPEFLRYKEDVLHQVREVIKDLAIDENYYFKNILPVSVDRVLAEQIKDGVVNEYDISIVARAKKIAEIEDFVDQIPAEEGEKSNTDEDIIASFIDEHKEEFDKISAEADQAQKIADTKRFIQEEGGKSLLSDPQKALLVCNLFHAKIGEIASGERSSRDANIDEFVNALGPEIFPIDSGVQSFIESNKEEVNRIKDLTDQNQKLAGLNKLLESSVGFLTDKQQILLKKVILKEPLFEDFKGVVVQEVMNYKPINGEEIKVAAKAKKKAIEEQLAISPAEEGEAVKTFEESQKQQARENILKTYSKYDYDDKKIVRDIADKLGLKREDFRSTLAVSNANKNNDKEDNLEEGFIPDKDSVIKMMFGKEPEEATLNETIAGSIEAQIIATENLMKKATDIEKRQSFLHLINIFEGSLQPQGSEKLQIAQSEAFEKFFYDYYWKFASSEGRQVLTEAEQKIGMEEIGFPNEHALETLAYLYKYFSEALFEAVSSIQRSEGQTTIDKKKDIRINLARELIHLAVYNCLYRFRIKENA